MLDKIKEKYKDAKVIADVLWGIAFTLRDYDIDSIFEEDGIVAIRHKLEPQAFKVLYDSEEDEYAKILE